jgi:hypothetical protein
MAEFEHPEELVWAVRRVREEGYTQVDAYTPQPVEGLSEALGLRESVVPQIVLAGGIFGALLGFTLQYYGAVMDYPLNVGGRPLNSWVSFIPITFEMTVLVASLFAVFFGVLGLNGLPCPYHAVFNLPRFARASQDRYFLCIEAKDPRFDRRNTRRLLENLVPVEVSEVAH